MQYDHKYRKIWNEFFTLNIGAHANKIHKLKRLWELLLHTPQNILVSSKTETLINMYNLILNRHHLELVSVYHYLTWLFHSIVMFIHTCITRKYKHDVLPCNFTFLPKTLYNIWWTWNRRTITTCYVLNKFQLNICNCSFVWKEKRGVDFIQVFTFCEILDSA